MSALALCADFISSGQVLGQGLHSTPDAWDHALGDPDWPLVDVRRHLMRRDFGMIEVGFTRHGVDWTCTHATIQVHRLGRDLEQLVPPGIGEAYGPIEPKVTFSDLLDAEPLRGVQAELILDRDTTMMPRYWFAQNETIVFVQGPDNEAPGSLWAVGVARDADHWKRPHG